MCTKFEGTRTLLLHDLKLSEEENTKKIRWFLRMNISQTDYGISFKFGMWGSVYVEQKSVLKCMKLKLA